MSGEVNTAEVCRQCRKTADQGCACVRVTNRCERCGKDFTGHFAQKYCSHECKTTKVCKCATCGTSFTTTHRRKYCRVECQGSRIREARVCEVCGTGVGKGRRYCGSDACKAALAARYRPDRMPERKCRFCDNVFIPRNAAHFCCSESCRTKWKRRNGSHYLTSGQLDRNIVGTIGELTAATKYMADGWHVYRAVSSTAPFDLVAFKDGVTKRIECRVGRYSTGALTWDRDTNPGVDCFAVVTLCDGEVHERPVVEGGIFTRR